MASSGSGSSTSRGKRPRVDAYLVATPVASPSGYRTASQREVDTVLMELRSNTEKLKTFDPSAFNADTLRVLEKTTRNLSTVATHVHTHREKLQKRPVGEVLLPLDLLAHALCFLSPRELGIVTATCRGVKLAVEAAMDSKIRALGVRAGPKQMTAYRLDKITSQVARAPTLLQPLRRDEYRELRGFDLCVLANNLTTLKRHIDHGLAGQMSDRDNVSAPYGYAWSLLRSVARENSVVPPNWMVDNIEMIIAAINAEFDFSGQSYRVGNSADEAMTCFSLLPHKVACAHLPRILHALNPNRDGALLFLMLDFLNGEVPLTTLAANRDTLLQVLRPLLHYGNDDIHNCNEKICKLAGSLVARVASQNASE